jgi:response regulator RpfG family c-di-GMP phosphodiesterase
MDPNTKWMQAGADETLFADESTCGLEGLQTPGKWKVIIADDEVDVHEITRIVLDDFKFEDRGLTLLSAYSGQETLQLLADHPDTAVILLDVVMETDDDGLEVARRIRQEQGNRFVRIILRTGHPGMAPENRVITDYDINDYKEKTELTAQKLFSAITSALRAYRDLRIIEQNRRGLEQIIESSADLFEIQSLRRFANGVLTQLLSILHLDESAMLMQDAAYAAALDNGDFIIIAATGKFEPLLGKPANESIPQGVWQLMEQATRKRKSLFVDNAYVGFFETQKGSRHLLYLNGCKNLTDMDKGLIRIFSTNISVALENLDLNQEIIETQKEVIMILGEVIENRSKETGNHVRRVAEVSYLLALEAGLGEKKAALLRLASPMHDVGKVGIPDRILFKPTRLSRGELAVIRSHTDIGVEILKNSRREIMEAAVLAAQQHHERWDGAGYPSGLKGEEIHIFGRITALADVFDSLIHRRIYKDAWALDRVLDYLRDERGRHFDPLLVDIFLNKIDEVMAINARYPDEAVA